MNINEDAANKISLQCMLRLKAHYSSFKSAEKKAADFLTENPVFVATSTIAESARRAGCSEPTFVRLARKLGYSGFTELKEKLLRDSDDPITERIYKSIKKTDDSRVVVESVFGLAKQAIDDTLRIFDFDEYHKAVEAIKNANKIAVFGIGDAAAVAMSAYVKFTRIGYDCVFETDPDLMLMISTHLKKGDVAMLISHSGRTKCIVNTAKALKNGDATVLSITNFPVTPLVKNSDICLQTSAFTEHLKGEVMANRVVGLCIVESIYIDVIRGDENRRDNMDKCNVNVLVNKL